MSYTTLAFFVALAPVTLIAWALPTRAKAPWLLLASYAFYATWSVRYLLLLLAVTAVVYGGARAIGRTEDERRRRAVLHSCR